MKKLPEPQHEYGYPSSQLDVIIKDLGIKPKEFNNAFGVNTCVINEKTGENIYYVCDVQNALYRLGHKLGKWHPWD
jgi:hypothetical protein